MVSGVWYMVCYLMTPSHLPPTFLPLPSHTSPTSLPPPSHIPPTSLPHPSHLPPTPLTTIPRADVLSLQIFHPYGATSTPWPTSPGPVVHHKYFTYVLVQGITKIRLQFHPALSEPRCCVTMVTFGNGFHPLSHSVCLSNCFIARRAPYRTAGAAELAGAMEAEA